MEADFHAQLLISAQRLAANDPTMTEFDFDEGGVDLRLERKAAKILQRSLAGNTQLQSLVSSPWRMPFRLAKSVTRSIEKQDIQHLTIIAIGRRQGGVYLRAAAERQSDRVWIAHFGKILEWAYQESKEA